LASVDTGAEGAAPDALDQAEILRERIRIVLKRRGILFRALLERELPDLRFSALFPAMRRMELSGELMAGLFFHGIQGPQFMSPEGLRLFRSLDEAEPAVFVISAVDPASLCGLGIEGLSAPLPPRAPQNALVYRGSWLLMASRKGGAEIDLYSEEFAAQAFQAYSSWLDRRARAAAAGRARILTINGESALKSPFAEAARGAGFNQGLNGLEYYPRA
jgi:ATP-dependent Lhr-like helicase